MRPQDPPPTPKPAPTSRQTSQTECHDLAAQAQDSTAGQYDQAADHDDLGLDRSMPARRFAASTPGTVTGFNPDEMRDAFLGHGVLLGTT